MQQEEVVVVQRAMGDYNEGRLGYHRHGEDESHDRR